MEEVSNYNNNEPDSLELTSTVDQVTAVQRDLLINSPVVQETRSPQLCSAEVDDEKMEANEDSRVNVKEEIVDESNELQLDKEAGAELNEEAHILDEINDVDLDNLAGDDNNDINLDKSLVNLEELSAIVNTSAERNDEKLGERSTSLVNHEDVDMFLDEPEEEDDPAIPCSMPDVQSLSLQSRDNYFENKTFIELSRHSWGTRKQHYLRGCRWSPDGTCILSAVNRDGMHIFELPLDLYSNETVSPDRPLDLLNSIIHVKECGPIYDYCWYPFMNSTTPESCCWISSGQHGPIQMWDAFDGKLRCSYRGYDAVDEVEAALSICFSTDGTQVIGGYKKSVKIFQTDKPGRDFVNFPLKSPASCLAVNNLDENIIAIGSWNANVALHDVRSPRLDIIQLLQKHTGGVTHMQFSGNGKWLVTGARKDSKLLCWDIRQTNRPLLNMSRTVDTNQTIYFDLSCESRWLASGDTKGIVHVWDLNRPAIDGKLSQFQFTLHSDCCNGVSLHPSRPILASSSGQHHFDNVTDDKSNAPADVAGSPKKQENSLILWWYGDGGNSMDTE